MTIPFRSLRVMGIRVTPITIEQLLHLVAQAVSDNKKWVIASQNLHGVYTYFKDEKFRTLHEDDNTCVHIDGMPIIWLGRLAGLPLTARHRTAWIDWFMPLMQAAGERGWRVYYLGGREDVLIRGLERIRESCPQVSIAGHHGFFEAECNHPENRAVLDDINRFRTDLLIVGMGMGRQEHWIVDNIADLRVHCIGTAGACMEYFAGESPTPPRWMGRVGIEWTYRLWEDPRRFAWRYLIEPWLTAGLLIAHQVRRRLGASGDLHGPR